MEQLERHIEMLEVCAKDTSERCGRPTRTRVTQPPPPTTSKPRTAVVVARAVVAVEAVQMLMQKKPFPLNAKAVNMIFRIGESK